MSNQLTDLYDIEELKSLCESFSEYSGMVTAIVDLNGEIIIATGWQSVCTEFHRKCELTNKRCVESDTILASKMAEGAKFHMYKCKNGLVDVAVPIYIGENHVGNFFTGQFFTDKPDLEFFRKQAKQFGFNEAAYIEAILKVPVLTEELVRTNVNFLVRLTDTVGKIGFKNLRIIGHARQLREEKERLKMLNQEFILLNDAYKLQNEELVQKNANLKRVEDRLKQSNAALKAKNVELNEAVVQSEKAETLYRLIADNTTDSIWVMDSDLQFTYLSPSTEKMFGYTLEEWIHLNWSKFVHSGYLTFVNQVFDNLRTKGNKPSQSFSIPVKHKNGSDMWVEFSADSVFDEDDSLVGIVGISRDITKRKTVELELQNERTLTQSYLDTANAIMISLDTDGVVTMVNRYGLEFLGCDASQIVGQNWFEAVLPAELHDEVNAVFKKIVRRELNAVRVYENEILTYSGERRTVFWSNNYHLNDAGEIIGVLSSGIDITDRKIAEEALRESEERFKALHNASFGGIVIHDKGVILECNLGLSEMTGYAYDELIGMDGLELIAPADRAYVMENIASGYEHPYEADGMRKNGEIFPMRLEARNIPYKGKLVRSVEFRDITLQKRTERQLIEAKEKAERSEETLRKLYRELKESEEETKAVNVELLKSKATAEESEFKVRSMFENTQIGILYCNTKGEVLEANNALLEILGSPSNVATQKINLLTFEPLREVGFSQNVERCIRENIKITEDTVYTSKWGKTVFMKYYLVPVFINGRVVGVWANLNNLTDLWRTQRELITAKEKAEESNRLKSAFLQNLSHEIRTPLNAICGFAGMLNKPGLKDEKRKHYTSIIQNSGSQLLGIVTDVLTISSLETKQEKLNIDKVCVNSIIVELLAIFKQQIIDNKISLYAKQELTDEQSTIFTDKTKITQILTNLISNALKFTHEGYVEFGYKLKNDQLEFFVQDSGIGIKPEMQQVIFERFRQADLSINKRYGGTGLGLAISKGFVELLGGEIWVESESGNGSVFFFNVPYSPVHKAEETQRPDKVQRPSILVAEDEEFNFLYIEELLIDFDCELIHTKNGKETVDVFTANDSISLILMDIKMPVMDGFTAAKLIKAHNPHVPIIAQSAYALEDEVEKYKDAFDDYLTKPIDEGRLKLLIDKYMH